ncbi:MAG TPA: hypothetical protein PK562_08080, partial [Candidatus Omnitrophota bacterium]|nr:hypothetical protein [Candidatus Omnitrophota bacterium]
MKYAAAGILILCMLVVAGPFGAFAQIPAQEDRLAAGGVQAPAAMPDSLAAAENVTLDFKEADIHNVLKILAQKSGLNIVSTPDVMGTVTIKLTE